MINKQWDPKDPDENKDYRVEYSNLLGADDTITASVWTIVSGSDGALVLGNRTNTTKTTVVWLTGGTNGQSYYLLNRITTAGGRTFDRTFKLKVETL